MTWVIGAIGAALIGLSSKGDLWIVLTIFGEILLILATIKHFEVRE